MVVFHLTSVQTGHKEFAATSACRPVAVEAGLAGVEPGEEKYHCKLKTVTTDVYLPGLLLDSSIAVALPD